MDPLQARVATAVEAYDRQGDHRTASREDRECADWLAGEAAALGVECTLVPFDIDRVDPQACFVEIGGERIEGLPMFDAAFTGREGVRGRLGPLGSDAEIGLAETAPSRLTQAGSERRRGMLSEVRQSGHKAVVLATRGSRPGLYALNAPAFTKPFGPPTLQVSSLKSEWLSALARERTDAVAVIHARRTSARAFNVCATIAGSRPELAPLVVMTPRSGWWRCAAERGSGVACWLEAMRAVAGARPARDCHFVAFSGHELGSLGIHAYLNGREALVRGTHAWIQIGANIGASSQPGLLVTSDAALEAWASAALEEQGIRADTAPRGATPFGEARVIHERGGRYAALICESELFHSVEDRWPDAIDVALLARYARALAQGITALARNAD